MGQPINPQPQGEEQAHIPALCVARVPIFNHLPVDELSAIGQKASMQNYARGSFIHRPGDASNRLFIVHRGKVKVYRLADTGKEQLVRILRAGDFAGEMALFSSTEHDSYAEVLQTAEICSIYRADVQELLRQYPDISLYMLAELATRLGSSEKQTAAISITSINARLGQYLTDLVEKENSTTVTLPMSRRLLSSYLGTTPETVSRRLGEFEKQGWIQQSGQRTIKVLDADALMLVE